MTHTKLCKKIEQLRRLAVEACAANPRHVMADQHLVGAAVLALLDQINNLLAQLAAARAVLREHEWCEYELSKYGCSSDRYCQHCGARKGEGIRPNDEHGNNYCAWKRAMGET